MVTLEWDLDRTDGVTLVRAFVTARRPHRVRVENRLDGPVWPPRRRGRPATGWDEDGFEGVAAPNDRLVGGYATPAPPEEPPVELAVEEPADEHADERTATECETRNAAVPSVEATPTGVIRTLGDPLVPRDAVPVPDADAESARESKRESEWDSEPESESDPAPDPSSSSDGDVNCSAVESRSPETDPRDATAETLVGPADAPTSERSRAAETATDRNAGASGRDAIMSGRNAGATGGRERTDLPEGAGADLVVPGAVRAWLADVERRVAAVERREGVDRGSALGTAVAGDRRALARVADRVGTLTERVNGVDVAADAACDETERRGETR